LINAEEPEIEQITESEKLELLHPKYKTRPRVYYKNLYRYFECFIGGSVAVEQDSVIDCAEGAKVTLIKDLEKREETMTDNYGDFKFDRLEENSGRYNIEITFEGHEKKTLELDLKESLNLGTIIL
jgi:hypothetical protein